MHPIRQTYRSLLLLICFMIVSSGHLFAQPAGIAEIIHKTILADGVEAAIAQYKSLKNSQPDSYDFSEGQLNNLGYQLMGEGRMAEAGKILRLNIEQFPNSANVYDSYAEYQMLQGNNAAAIKNYHIVLEKLAEAEMPAPQKNFFINNAKSKIFQAENFQAPSAEAVNYTAYVGGNPAEKWDMHNLATYKTEKEAPLSYKSFNLYRSPVPRSIPTPFTSQFKADVISGFVRGVYRDYVASGEIADISGLWESEGWNEAFPESFRDMSSYNGKQYFVPQAFQFNPIWYRTDIFDTLKLSPPQSWEELLTLCDKLHAAGYLPFTVSARGWPPPVARWFTILNLRLNGAEFHETVMQGKVAYTDDRIREVFQYWGQLFEHHAFSDTVTQTNYAQAVRELASGKAAMYNLGEWLFESWPANLNDKLDFFIVPNIRPEVPRAEIVHAYGAFLTAAGKEKPAAKTLLRYLGNQASQQSNTDSLKRIVPHNKVTTAHYSEVQHRLFETVKNTGTLVPLFEFNTDPRMAQAGLQAFVAFCKNPKDIESVLQQLEAKRQEVYGDVK